MDPTGSASCWTFRSCYMARSESSMLALASPSYFSETFPLFLMTCTPHITSTKAFHHSWPLDCHHHDRFLAGYRPIPVNTCGDTTVFIGDGIFTASFHHCSAYRAGFRRRWTTSRPTFWERPWPQPWLWLPHQAAISPLFDHFLANRRSIFAVIF